MCTTGCPTQDCPSYAACLRKKAPKVAYCNSAGGFDYTRQKNWDKDLDAYAEARAQGIQPESTNRKHVEDAVIMSDLTGKAFEAE